MKQPYNSSPPWGTPLGRGFCSGTTHANWRVLHPFGQPLLQREGSSQVWSLFWSPSDTSTRGLFKKTQRVFLGLLRTVRAKGLIIFYYTFNWKGYYAYTGHLSAIEDLAYRRLMDIYYRDEAAPRGSVQDVARLIRLRENLQEVEAVLGEFFEFRDGAWVNEVCEENLKKMVKAANVARENGANGGGRPKGSKDKQPRKPRNTGVPDDKTQRVPSGMPAGTERDASGMPLGTQRGASKKLPITHNPLHSAPDGAGAAAPVDNSFHVPSSFPPNAVTIAPPPPMPPSPPEAAATPPAPSPLVPPPAAPPAPLMPAGGLFDDDARNRLLDAAADELDPDELDRLRTGAPPPLSVLPLREPDEFVLPRGPFVDEKDEIYKIGKPLLVHGGMAKDKAGGMVTKWVRDTRNLSIVLDAIHEAVRTKAADPLTFIQRLVHDADRGRGRKAYPGSLKGMDYTAPSDFIEGFPEADLMSDWDGSPQ